MIGDGSTSSSGQNQDHVRVSANVMTADGGTSTAFTCDQAISEVPTISTVHFAKSASDKAYSPTAFTSLKVALCVVPVRVEGENRNSVNTWAWLDNGSEESFIAKHTADKLNLRVKGFESLAVCTYTRESTVRMGRVDLAVLPIEGPEGHRIQIKDVKVVEHLNVNKSRPLDQSKWEHVNDIPLRERLMEKKLNCFLGANVPEVQIHEDVRVGGAGEPYTVRTVLGWAIMGTL